MSERVTPSIYKIDPATDEVVEVYKNKAQALRRISPAIMRDTLAQMLTSDSVWRHLHGGYSYVVDYEFDGKKAVGTRAFLNLQYDDEPIVRVDVKHMEVVNKYANIYAVLQAYPEEMTAFELYYHLMLNTHEYTTWMYEKCFNNTNPKKCHYDHAPGYIIHEEKDRDRPYYYENASEAAKFIGTTATQIAAHVSERRLLSKRVLCKYQVRRMSSATGTWSYSNDAVTYSCW
jgi:hypothetical protein